MFNGEMQGVNVSRTDYKLLFLEVNAFRNKKI